VVRRSWYKIRPWRIILIDELKEGCHCNLTFAATGRKHTGSFSHHAVWPCTAGQYLRSRP
jgi:hypothetical protein